MLYKFLSFPGNALRCYLVNLVSARSYTLAGWVALKKNCGAVFEKAFKNSLKILDNFC